MPALNYLSRFAALVESGQKCQTIRAKRKRPFKVGDTLTHYAGQRTTSCRFLGEAICRETQPILIIPGLVPGFGPDNYHFRMEVWVGTKLLNQDEMQALAYADGFKTLGEFLDFFDSATFAGQIIKWDAPLRPRSES